MPEVQPAPHVRRFTVAEYRQMYTTGVLDEKRSELLDGKIYTMRPIGVRHAWVVDHLTKLFIRKLPAYHVRAQNPIQLNDYSEPEPDIAILHATPDPYAAGHPEAAQVALLVEIAESSLVHDREVRAPLYARASITTYWLLNLQDNQLEVFAEPNDQGYVRQQIHPPSGSVKALGETWEVGELLGTA